MSKNKAQTNKTYQIRPPFKDKFRPAEAKKIIEEIVHKKLANANYSPNDQPVWTKEIADQTKQALK